MPQITPSSREVGEEGLTSARRTTLAITTKNETYALSSSNCLIAFLKLQRG